MLPHNKIIKTTVKEFLEPENLFQIGSSRSWVDDNGTISLSLNLQQMVILKGQV